MAHATLRRRGRTDRSRTHRMALGALLAAVLATGWVEAAAAPAATDHAGAVLTTQAAAAELDDSFYVPPSTLPAGAPGDVVRSRTAPAGPTPTQRIADSWQVMYLSTDALGARQAMTGTVLVPKSIDAAAAPVVGFAPGTQGVSFTCAPSKMIASGSFYEQPAVTAMLRQGYAVAVPDYEGYRAQPSATYMTGPSMGQALLDVVRAAQRLPAAGLADDGRVLLRGYSQGGAAALWAAEKHPTYAPELDLLGVVGGGVPANLSQVALPLNGSDGFGLLAIALIGFDNAYPELNLETYLNDAGRAAFTAMESGDCALDLLLKYRGKSLADYTSKNPLSELPWLIRVSESSLGTRSIDVPVFQYHATTDGLVAFGQADSLHQQYCAKGVRLEWKTFDTASLGTTPAAHISPISWANDDAMDFLADRLAGAPATTSC